MTELLTECSQATGGAEPVVSAAVPVLDGGDRLAALVRALREQRGTGGPVEILLADSGSRDGAVDRLRDLDPQLRIFEVAPGAFDHGLVRSALVRAARAPLVALLSQDAVPRDHACLAQLMAAFDTPEVVGAYARQIPRDGADPLVAATLTRWTPPGSRIEYRRLRPDQGWTTLSGEERMNLARFDNVCSMVRRDALLQRPFPAADFGEDILWGAQVIQGGGVLAYVPGAQVVHSHEPRLLQTFLRHRAAHHQAARDFDLRAVPSLFALGQALLTGLPGDLQDGGLAWAVRGLPRRSAALLGQWAGGRAGDEAE